MRQIETHKGSLPTLNGEPIEVTGTEKRRRSLFPGRTVLNLGIVALVGIVSLPRQATAQFTDIFTEIFSSIQSDMGVSLKAINQITQDTQQLYQVTMWPLAAINQVRGFVSTTISGYRNAMNLTFTTPYNSATLPATQQLETILHSQQSTQISALQQSFTTNFGAVPQANAASSQDRVMIDIDDALAQENLKTTLISDEAGNTLLSTANAMENQVALSTPGSNPFLTAQSQVAILRSQAFLQKMLAAELRQEAGRIAHDNVLVKRKTSATLNINSLINGALQAH
jgi:hypothetical protein